MTVIPFAIDPYNVFHTTAVRDNGVEPNKNYIKMNYILNNPEKYDSLLFGSSRVGAIHTDKISGEHCYNMTYSEGLPNENLDNIKTLIANEVPIKKIYIGVDNLSYTLDPLSHQSEPLRVSYEYSLEHPIDFWLLYFDPAAALKSLETTAAYTPEENFSEKLYSYGWWCDYGEESKLTTENAFASIGHFNYWEETLAIIAEMNALCEEHDIELVVFTNPLYAVTYDESLNHNYLDFIRGLASITGFYNFSGINDITLNTDNFTDNSHYNAEVGDLMLEYMCNGKTDGSLYEQGFGVYVTLDNLDDVLALLSRTSADVN